MLGAVSLLKEHALTVTPQRVELLSILSSHPHINVDELYTLLHASFPSISLATAYKNINVMIDKTLLVEVQIPNKKNVYEIKKEAHSHIVCLECKKIIDIEIDTSKLLEAASSQSGYNIQKSTLVFSGTCSDCSG